MKLEKFLAVIKLTSGEEVVARISELENMDKILIDSPAMMNCTSPSRRPGINMIKIEPWIKSGKETTYIIDMSKIITTSEILTKTLQKHMTNLLMHTIMVLKCYHQEVCQEIWVISLT